MGLLTGKRFLITGVISNRSIAYGIAQAFLIGEDFINNDHVTFNNLSPGNSYTNINNPFTISFSEDISFDNHQLQLNKERILVYHEFFYFLLNREAILLLYLFHLLIET